MLTEANSSPRGSYSKVISPEFDGGQTTDNSDFNADWVYFCLVTESAVRTNETCASGADNQTSQSTKDVDDTGGTVGPNKTIMAQ